MNYEDRITKEYVEGLLAGMPKIETGSYVGTGQVGAEHPNSVTLGFVPKLLLLEQEKCVYSDSYGYQGMKVFCENLTESYVAYKSGYDCSIKIKMVGTTVSWYHDSSDTLQYNDRKTYYYVAFG